MSEQTPDPSNVDEAEPKIDCPKCLALPDKVEWS
jgi:hypothetical protein